MGWSFLPREISYFFTVDISRRSNVQARKYLFEDLRGKDKLAFGEISFLVAPGQHLQPNEQAASVREKDVRFTLVDIPKALTDFAPHLGGIGGIIHPDQDMVDWIMREIAKAHHKDPPYEPYLVVRLDIAPWLPPSHDHTAALTNWRAQSKQARRVTLPQEVSIQAFCLYHLRFLLAAEICHAFDPFGGLAPQISHMGTVLALAVTEHIGIALAYHRVVNQKLQEKARQRVTTLSAFTDVLKERQFTLAEQVNANTT